MSFLIDTDILIYSLKNNETVRSNFLEHANAFKALSVITYGELVFGALRSEHPTRAIATARRIAGLFPIIEVSNSIIETFADLKAQLYKKGNPVDDMDLIIAATALANNLTLVTNNERHFSHVPGLPVENWSRG